MATTAPVQYRPLLSNANYRSCLVRYFGSRRPYNIVFSRPPQQNKIPYRCFCEGRSFRLRGQSSGPHQRHVQVHLVASAPEGRAHGGWRDSCLRLSMGSICSSVCPWNKKESCQFDPSSSIPFENLAFVPRVPWHCISYFCSVRSALVGP
jgi:hypothetical protein